MSQASRSDRIAFQPFDLEARLDDMIRWLGDPDVQPWYDEGELSEENIRRQFAPEDGLHRYTIVIDDQPVGYIQAYRVGNEPEYQKQIDVDPDAVATDLFIGEPGFRNAGWGTELLRVFHERIVFGEMGAELAMIGPSPENHRAVASYSKVGFRPVKSVYVVDESPGNTGTELIMLLTREEFFTQST